MATLNGDGTSRVRDALRLLVELGEFRVVPEATGGRPRHVFLRRPENGWPAEIPGAQPAAAHA